MTVQPDNLEDAQIKLMPLKEEDFERLYSIASDPLIWEQHPSKDRYKREVFQLYFDGAVASQAAFLVFNKETNELIGCTRFYDYQPEQSSIAIGYTFLVRQYWGGNFNKSMKHLLLTHAFQFVDVVKFHIGITNIRSQMAIQKIGAIKVSEVDFESYGKKAPHYEYEIHRNNYLPKL